MSILLKNGNVVTDKVVQTNLFVKDGRIEAVTDETPDAETVVDCTGKYIVPGLIDMHVHLREPGQEYKETLESGSRAATAGGVTTMCCMANTSPVIDNSALVSWIIKRGQEIGLADILPFACVTRGMKGEELTDMGDLLSAGACGFSDDGRPVVSAEVMRRALEYSSYFGAFISCHEEDETLFNHGSAHEGKIATKCGLIGIPGEAESVMVARDIQLARLTGGRVHICHVSSRHSIEAIRQAKLDGLKVTAEVTPHHLTFNEELCEGYDPNSKTNPPLRSEEDRLALIGALKDGTIDCVASDHAPHHIDDKFMEFDLAAFGILGLQFIVPMMLKKIESGILNWTDFVRVCSTAPAALLNLNDRGCLVKGRKADITIIDAAREYVFDQSVNKSLSCNTPLWGQKLKGAASMVIKNGKVIFK